MLATHAYGLPCRVDEIQAILDVYAHRRSRPVFVVYDAFSGPLFVVGAEAAGPAGRSVPA